MKETAAILLRQAEELCKKLCERQQQARCVVITINEGGRTGPKGNKKQMQYRQVP